MKHLTFWFDPVSPLAHLAFERLPQQLEGVSYSVAYRPVQLKVVLAHWARTGPLDVEPERAWSLRFAHWLAHQHGIELATPAPHPFDSEALSRLLLACASPATRTPNRLVCETVLRHVWHGGADANDAQRLAALTQTLAPRSDPADAKVQQALHDATVQAIAHGVFAVPTIEVDDRLFCGFEALPMLSAYLRGDAWFDSDQWAAKDAEGQ